MCKDENKKHSYRDWLFGGLGTAGVVAAVWSLSYRFGATGDAETTGIILAAGLLVLLCGSLGLLILLAWLGHVRAMREQTQYRKNVSELASKIEQEIADRQRSERSFDEKVKKLQEDVIKHSMETFSEKKEELKEQIIDLIQLAKNADQFTPEIIEKLKHIMEEFEHGK